MKRKLLLFSCLFYGYFSYAQDIILKTNGDEISAKVETVEINEVKYKHNGQSASLPKTDVFMIKYANGSKDWFGRKQKQQAVTAAPAQTKNATAAVTVKKPVYIYKLTDKLLESAWDF